MSKWKQQRDPAQDKAQEMLPALRIQRDAWLASFTEETFPENATHVFLHTVLKPALDAEFGTEYSSLSSSVRSLLQAELEKPIAAHVRAMYNARAKVARALVDTNRPVVAVMSGTNQIGELVIWHQKFDTDHVQDQIVVCIASGSRYSEHDDANEDVSNFAECNDSEKQSDRYQQLLIAIAANQKHAQFAREHTASKLEDMS